MANILSWVAVSLVAVPIGAAGVISIVLSYHEDYLTRQARRGR